MKITKGKNPQELTSKKPKNKQTSKILLRQTQITKQGKMKQEVYKHSTEFVLCWPATLENGAFPEVLCIYLPRETPLEKKTKTFLSVQYQF